MQIWQLVGSAPSQDCTFYQFVRGLWVDAVVTLAVGGHADPVKRTTHMLPEGYQKIWTTMAERDGIDVRFGVQIQSTWHARVMKFGSVADLRWSFMVMRYDCNH